MGFGFSKNFSATRNDISLDTIEAPSDDQNQINKELIEYEIVESSYHFDTLSTAFDYLQRFSIDENHKSVFLFRFEINEIFINFNIRELKILAKIFKDSSALLYLVSKNNEKCAVHWKLAQNNYFLTLKPYDSYNMSSNTPIYRYIVEFLKNALAKGHAGITHETAVNPLTYEVELNSLEDHRSFNVLLSAVDDGNISIIKQFMDLCISLNTEEHSAQLLAYEKGHQDILLMLLDANATFPEGIDYESCSAEVKEFKEICDKLHERIRKKKSAEKIEEIISKKRHLRYFYNELNESAAAFAMKLKLFDIYEILLQNGLSFGPEEDIKEIYENLGDDRKRVRELHVKYAKPMPDKYINIIMANTHVGHDVEDIKNKFKIIHNAYNILNNIELIRTILKIVAASTDFTIIFDFNRDSVQLTDPTASSFTKGLCYFSGRIFIGAKDLLDEIKSNEVLGVIAHEFCHYALALTYLNKAKPYRQNDYFRRFYFRLIAFRCQRNGRNEEIVSSVFRFYPKQEHHAELAVRAAHMLAHYNEQTDKIEESRQTFKELFEFVENKVAPDMKKEIPRIKLKIKSNEHDLNAQAYFKTKVKKIVKNNPVPFLITIGVLLITLISIISLASKHKINTSQHNQTIETTVKDFDETSTYRTLTSTLQEPFKNTTTKLEETTPKAIPTTTTTKLEETTPEATTTKTEETTSKATTTKTEETTPKTTPTTTTTKIEDTTPKTTLTTTTRKPYGAFYSNLVVLTTNLNGKDNKKVQCGTRNIVKGIIQSGTVVRGEYPWNAALISHKIGFICGGTLVSNKHVLTAAHCVQGKYNSHVFDSNELLVLLGFETRTYPKDEGRISAKVKAIGIHADWNMEDESYDADIAVLELAGEIQFNNYIRPICIANNDTTISLNSNGIIVGFGLNESEKLSERAKKLDVKITSYQECFKQNQINQDLASTRMFCVGPTVQNGVSYANSGGGIYVISDNRYYLRGLLSWLPKNQEETNENVIATDALLALPGL